MSENEKKIENPSDEVAETDVEQTKIKYKYPRSIPFIISNEFCERFNFYGMKAILVIYLTQQLYYSDDAATAIYHIFSASVYFFCIFGAIIADSWWGKFRTILWLSMVYVAGSIIISLGSIEAWHMPASAFTILGLFLIALGSGGIKPCVAAFGGEQFKLPEQAAQVAIYFSMFYFSVNAGSLISTSITPILREDVSCFGRDDCYPLAFGLPAALMAVSILIFLAGKFLYKILPNQGNMLVKVCSCIAAAIRNKKLEKLTNPKEYWLEYAESTHGRKLVLETKILLNVLVLYLPLPFFWTLFDQQGSRWTFQATRMNGNIGFYELKPDQMQVINPLLILTFIPLYELIFYPLLSLIGIRRPLQKLTLGGIFAGIAFVLSAIVEINIEPTYAVVPGRGESQLRIFNNRPCDYTFTSNVPEYSSFSIKSMEYFEDQYVKLDKEYNTYAFTVSSASGIPGSPSCSDDVGTLYSFNLTESTAQSFHLHGITGQPLEITQYEDDPEKTRRGWSKIRVLANIDSSADLVQLLDNGNTYRHESNRTDVETSDVPFGKNNKIQIRKVARDGCSPADQGEDKAECYHVITDELLLEVGGVYTLLVNQTGSSSYDHTLITVTSPNSVNMLWLVPQYVVMTLGEVMYSITGLQFSFNEAPESMKSVLQGCWLLTVAVGNLIVVLITGLKFFEKQKYEFFLFAGLMFVDMIVFMFLARRYKSIPLSELDKVDENLLSAEKRSPLDIAGKTNDGLNNDE